MSSLPTLEYLGTHQGTDEVQPEVVNEIAGSPGNVHEFNIGALQEQYAKKLAGVALGDTEVRIAA